MVQVTPNSGEVITFRVDEVDLAQRVIHASDRTGGKFFVTFRAQGAFLQVPAIGEHWTANRVGFNWFLGSRVSDQNDLSDVADLEQGDARIETAGSIHLNSGGPVYVNGVELGTGGTAGSDSFATHVKWGNS